MDAERILRGKSRKVRFVMDNDGEKWYSAIDVVCALTGEDDYEKSRRQWSQLKKEYFSDDEDDNDLFLNKLRITASDGRQYMSDVLNKSGIRVVAIYIAFRLRTKGHNYKHKGNVTKALDCFKRAIVSVQ